MLKVKVPLAEEYDEETSTFSVTESYDLELEHSLVSLSKWEQKYEKPFLSDDPKTSEETFEYIKMMALPEVPEEIFLKLTDQNVRSINDYINSRMTATWFTNRDDPRVGRKQIITSEIIYYWMFSLNVDLECEHWHLNRLMTLIRVVNEKNTPPKKMGRAEMIQQRNRLNAQRRSNLQSTG